MGILHRLPDYAPFLVKGTINTIVLTGTSLLLASVIGVIIAVTRKMRVPLFSQALSLYVQLMRVTPELVLLFLVYYSLPQFGIVISAYLSALIVFSAHYSAFLSEVFRGGIESVPASQIEAGKVLQLRAPVMWFKVILPQAIRSVVPAWGNYLQTILKATALAGTITFGELFFHTNYLANKGFRYFELFTLAAVIYFVMSYIAARGQYALEKKLTKDRRVLT